MLLKSEDRAMQWMVFKRAKSIVGTVLVGLGIFIFYENLHRAAAQIGHILHAFPGETAGESPSLILTAVQFLQAYATDHQRFMHGFLLHTMASLWPLLLILAGTVLSRDYPTNKVSALPGKDC